MRNKRGGRTITYSQGSDNSSQTGGRYVTGNANMSQYCYENENFFETNNGALIEIKNIFESKQFWERINTFFAIKPRTEELEMLQSYYKSTPEQMQVI